MILYGQLFLSLFSHPCSKNSFIYWTLFKASETRILHMTLCVSTGITQLLQTLLLQVPCQSLLSCPKTIVLTSGTLSSSVISIPATQGDMGPKSQGHSPLQDGLCSSKGWRVGQIHLDSQEGGENLPSERMATPHQTTVRSSSKWARTFQNGRPSKVTILGRELWFSPSSLKSLKKKRFIREAIMNWKNSVQDVKFGGCASFFMRLKKQRAGLEKSLCAWKDLFFYVDVSYFDSG